MGIIATILIFVLAIVAYRLFRVTRAIDKIGGFENLKIKLPVGFFIEQMIGLICICLFYMPLTR